MRLNSKLHYPYVTALLFTTSVLSLYTWPDAPAAYEREASAWEGISYAWVHSDAEHLWFNMVGLLVAGALFESTESFVRAALLVITAAPAAAIGHSIFSENKLVGGSGYIYALITYQASLALLNWRQMRVGDTASSMLCSWNLRALLLGTMLVYEVATSLLIDSKTSHASHAFGAVAGVSTGLAIGSNMVEEVGETFASVAGVCVTVGVVCAGVWNELMAYIPMGAAAAVQAAWVLCRLLRSCVVIE